MPPTLVHSAWTRCLEKRRAVQPWIRWPIPTSPKKAWTMTWIRRSPLLPKECELPPSSAEDPKLPGTAVLHQLSCRSPRALASCHAHTPELGPHTSAFPHCCLCISMHPEPWTTPSSLSSSPSSILHTSWSLSPGQAEGSRASPRAMSSEGTKGHQV